MKDKAVIAFTAVSVALVGITSVGNAFNKVIAERTAALPLSLLLSPSLDLKKVL